VKIQNRILGNSFGRKNAEDVLSGFCQEIITGMTTSYLTLVTAGLLVEQLFQAFDGRKLFKREALPYGIQGLQELDWGKLNSELSPLHDQFLGRVRTKEGCLDAPLRKHIETVDGKQWTWFGDFAGLLVIVDESMRETAGLVRYRLHAFEIGIPRKNCSFQMFVNANDPSFRENLLMEDPVVSFENPPVRRFI